MGKIQSSVWVLNGKKKVWKSNLDRRSIWFICLNLSKSIHPLSNRFFHKRVAVMLFLISNMKKKYFLLFWTKWQCKCSIIANHSWKEPDISRKTYPDGRVACPKQTRRNVSMLLSSTDLTDLIFLMDSLKKVYQTAAAHSERCNLSSDSDDPCGQLLESNLRLSPKSESKCNAN